MLFNSNSRGHGALEFPLSGPLACASSQKVDGSFIFFNIFSKMKIESPCQFL